MDNYFIGGCVYKPRSIVKALRTPRQSLIALKLNDILLFVAENEFTKFSARRINALIPSLAHSERRNKVLDMLNELVLTFRDEHRQIKVYDYVTYFKGEYFWAYTPEYAMYFSKAGINLPSGTIFTCGKYVIDSKKCLQRESLN